MVQERTDVPEFMIGRFFFLMGGWGAISQKKSCGAKTAEEERSCKGRHREKFDKYAFYHPTPPLKNGPSFIMGS